MKFSKHISSVLRFAARGGARWRHWLAVCAFLAAASLTQFNHLWHLWPGQTQVAQAAALSDEAAVRQLKTDGGYASLSAALAAARYQINAAPAQVSQSGQSGTTYYANNPGQQLRATFASDEVRLSAASNKSESKTTDGAELRLRLTGYGYGDQFEPLTPGKPSANGDRITIRKSEIRNPKSEIEEWYVNKPEGLEQGFTLAVPPATRRTGEWLRVALAVGEGWRTSVRGDAQGALFERQVDGLRLGYDQLQAYDAQGRVLPARMALDGNRLALLVDDAQAIYPLTIDPILTQQQKLTAADGAAFDQLGAAVALSGNTAIIGAPAGNVPGAQGSAYVFVRNGTVWTQQQKLTANDGADGDLFGFSVAIIGDTAVVGAAFDSIGANVGQGSAYVFTRNGTTWTQQQKLTADDGVAFDNFGVSVAISGDTVVVGAQSDDIGIIPNQGSAYVFVRNSTTWALQQKLTANDGAANDKFGASVAISGDTVAVGAPLDDNDTNLDQGSVYIFVRSGVVWTPQQKLTAGDGGAGDTFGVSVALSGDTVAVGAPSFDFTLEGNEGAAYVFIRSSGVWMLQRQFIASDHAKNDHFGSSVALSADTLAASAPNHIFGSNGQQGAAYVFSRSGIAWLTQRELSADDGAAGDVFGRSVALSGDTVVVGASFADIGANVNQGAAYVFVICANNFVQQQPLTAGDGVAGDNFGISVALSGNTAVVGAPNNDIGANAAQGAAYIFIRSGGGWTFQQKLIANDGATADFFGFSVALSGDTVVVGAREDDIGAKENQGSAYVFTRNGTTWTQQQKLTANDGAANDNFGWSVAVSGDTVAVGAPFDLIGANGEQGSAYVFTRSGAVWTQQQKLPFDDGVAGNDFGWSVALSGDTLVVGVPFDTIGTKQDQGSAYVYVRSDATWTEQQKLIADDGAALDDFGMSVALSGDTVVVGAPFDTIGANANQGSAYVFARSGTAWTQQQKLTANDGAARDRFGRAVALNGDTAVVSAFRNAGGLPSNVNQGSAYVFTHGVTWTQLQRLIASNTALDNFGTSVALSGNTVMVGATANQGAVHVFVCPSCPAVTLNPDSLPAGIIGNPYSQTVTASSVGGGAGPFQFSLSDGALPPGLALTQDGVLSGTPTRTGTYHFTLTATVLNSLCPGSRSYTLTVTPLCPAITLNPATLPNATGGVAYSQMLTANGGAAPVSFAVTAGTLPNGLLLASSGLLSGTTTASGTFNFTVTATDANGCVAVKAYGLAVNTPPLFLNRNDPTVRQGNPAAVFEIMSVADQEQAPNTLNLTINGGATATVGGVTVSGLSISAAGRVSANVVANCAAAVLATFTLTATDNAGATASAPFAVGVNQNSPPVLSYANQALAAGGAATINPATGPSDNGSVASIIVQSAGAFTGTLNVNALTGVVTVANAQPGGAHTITIRATDNCGAVKDASFTLTVNCPTITVNPVTLPAGAIGQPYNQTLTAAGGSAPASFTVSAGALPNGVTLSSAGLLSGVPTAFGAFNFTAQATDANGCVGARAYSLIITPPCAAITLNPTSLPNGTVGAAYNQIITASGGTAPHTFTVSAGALPTGLSLAANGALTGPPTIAGDFNFTIKATDANGCTGTQAYSVTVTSVAPNNGLQFFPLSHPVRLLDTRPGQAGCFAPGAPINGGTPRAQPARGLCDGLNVPANAAAITGNITTVNSGGGFLTLFPSNAAQPLVANSNYAPNEIVNNVFTVGLGADGAFKISALNTTDVVVDVTGYYAPPATGGLYFHPLPHPIRLLETRTGFTGCTTPGALLPGNTETLQLARLTCDGVTIPAAAAAIVGNATTVIPERPGFLTLFPASAARPLAASSNYSANQIVNAPFTVGLSAAGTFKIFTTATTHLVIDVSGYYSAEAQDVNGTGLLFNPLSKPVRLLETRAGLTGCFAPGAPLSASTELPQMARGSCQGETVPEAALAIVGNATVVNAQGGFLTFWPSNAVKPLIATSNFDAGQVFNRHFTVGLGPDGAFKMFAQLQTDLVVDVTGYFAP